MNGAIEMPAEVSPLDHAALLGTLSDAASRSQQQIQSGAKQLQHWETKAGFYKALQDVCIRKDLPNEIRILSLLQLKNGIDKYWRRAALHAISADERDHVRARLLPSGVALENSQLVSLNAIIIAKVARQDFPLAWPTMIQELISYLRGSYGPKLLSALQISLQIIKELSTVRLARMKSSLYSNASEWLSVLGGLYQRGVDHWSQSIHALSPDVLEAMVTTEKCLKSIRRLIAAGFEAPGIDAGVQSFWVTSCSHLHSFFHLISTDIPPSIKLSIIRHMVQFAKLHHAIADHHPLSFVQLPESCMLAKTYWQYSTAIRTQATSYDESLDDDPEDAQLQSLCLRGLLLMRACFKLVFSPAIGMHLKDKHVREELDHGKEYFRKTLLQEEFVVELFRTLVEKFFFLNQADVDDWTTEAEEWEIRVEGGDAAYEHSVRPCAERLFLDIALNYKKLTISSLLALTNQISDASFTDPWTKDAVYNAIGLAAAILQGSFDFNTFLMTTLANDLQQSSPKYNIVRRRIAILIAQWSCVDIPDLNRPFINQTFQHLLDRNQSTNDLSVRMTAGKQFKIVADAWEFRPDAFVPFAPSILSALIGLIQEVDLIETKMALLATVTTVVERLEKRAVPFADQIVSLLPPLWAQSGNEHLMKQGIVAVLVQLVKALGRQSEPLHALVIPIISSALEPGSETRVYLFEDAIDLWRAILSQTADGSVEIMSLAPYIYPLFDMDHDMVEKAFHLTESYILLAPSELLQDTHRQTILGTFAKLLGDKKPWINDYIAENYHRMIRAADDLGGVPAVQLVVQHGMELGLLPKMLSSLDLDWECHQTSGPNRKPSPPDWKNESSYFVVLARIIIISVNVFLALIQQWSTNNNREFNVVLAHLLEEAFGNMDAIGEPEKSKLICMALTKLLETNEPFILNKLQDLMGMWTTRIVDLRHYDSDRTGDSLVYTKPDDADAEKESSPGETRRSNLMYADIVHTVNLSEFVKYHLNNVIEKCGGFQSFQQEWLVNVDEDVTKAFAELGVM